MGEQSNRECDYCGEGFRTLTRLRLHDCRLRDVGEALIPDPDPEDLPAGRLSAETLDAIAAHEAVEEVEQAMNMPADVERDVISFVISTDGTVYGLHSHHDTGEWEITVTGDDFATVEEENRHWLANEIEKFTGESVSPDNVNPDLPSTITRECEYCGDTHELHPDFEPEVISMGELEYNGYCDKTGKLLIEMNPEEVADAV
jgi:hypothetical protein